MKVSFTQSGTSRELSDVVFGAQFKESLLHQTLVSCQGNSRANIASNKSRSDVRGHARKPWRQKGTGRARHGSSKSPLWRGGGLAFASNKPNWQTKINRKAYRACLRVILSQLLREERLLFIEQAYDGEPRTQQLQQWRKDIGLEASTLLVVEHLQIPRNLILATRNLVDFDVCSRHEVNPVRLLRFNNVALTDAAATQLNEDLQ